MTTSVAKKLCVTKSVHRFLNSLDSSTYGVVEEGIIVNLSPEKLGLPVGVESVVTKEGVLVSYDSTVFSFDREEEVIIQIMINSNRIKTHPPNI